MICKLCLGLAGAGTKLEIIEQYYHYIICIVFVYDKHCIQKKTDQRLYSVQSNPCNRKEENMNVRNFK